MLIKLRAKLNEEKIKLWESPYVLESGEISPSLKVFIFGIVCFCLFTNRGTPHSKSELSLTESFNCAVYFFFIYFRLF